MKILHINNFDIKGGAAKAVYSLCQALKDVNVEAKLLVQHKHSNDEDVISITNSFLETKLVKIREVFDTASQYIFSKSKSGKFSFGHIGVDISQLKPVLEADILHFHWITGGFLSLRSINRLINLNKPIVWTLHDMWAFTGGCHYSSGCNRYRLNCGQCPMLKFTGEKDFSKRILNQKERIYRQSKISIVTCSNWLGEVAKSSFLLKDFDIRAIPNTLDVNVYKPIDKSAAREKLNLRTDKIMILFGTMTTKDKRKGFYLLKSAIFELSKNHPELANKIELLIFGRSNSAEINLPFKVNHWGRVSDDEMLSLIYNAADFSIVPSLEDNLPNTVMESLACGTPVVAFNIGGIPDMIDHLENGYLSDSVTPAGLNEGILWILEQIIQGRNFVDAANNKFIRNFSPQIIATQYQQLYSNII